MKSLPTLFQVQDLKTTLPVTPARELCQALGYTYDWLEPSFKQWHLHCMYLDGQLQLSHAQAQMLAHCIGDFHLREQALLNVSQSFSLHSLHQNP